MQSTQGQRGTAERWWSRAYYASAVLFVASFPALFVSSFLPDSKFINPLGLKNPWQIALIGILFWGVATIIAGKKNEHLYHKAGWRRTANRE